MVNSRKKNVFQNDSGHKAVLDLLLEQFDLTWRCLTCHSGIVCVFTRRERT